ncbi:DNA polymerase eta-like isoform X3 [Dysidea avara]|uniref:DNA polymerase eta-like isoform X3 n=1 Tax=Dysidea avara TaxID=196820 RepID=UPI003330970B
MDKMQEQQRSKIILLVDMDCFYVQVEQRDEPSTRGKPCVVVQYKKFRGGSILAVGYEARKFGISRMLRGDEAKEKCPDITLFQVPEKRGKADLTKYRLAGSEVIKVLSRYCDCVERASIDEAFLDVTSVVMERIRQHHEGNPLITSTMLPGTHIAGYSAESTTDGEPFRDGSSRDGWNFNNDDDLLEEDVLLQDMIECGDDGSSDWLDPSVVTTDPNYPRETVSLSTEANTSKNDAQDTSHNNHTNPEANGDELLTHWLCTQGANEDQLLAVAAVLTSEIREAVRKETGFTCSAGISHNKMLAKLAAGMNKPNQQTIAPFSSVDNLMDNTPIRKIRHLGGKFGQQLTTELGVINVGELRRFSEAELQTKFGLKQGSWVYQLCRGVDHEKVKSRHLPLSVGCGKNFNGPEKLTSPEQVQHWLLQFSKELAERLSEDSKSNHRRATHLGVHFRCDDGRPAVSRSCPLDTNDAQAMSKLAWSALCKSGKNGNDIISSCHAGVTGLAMNATKFITDTSHQHNTSLHSYLKPSTNTSGSGSSSSTSTQDHTTKNGNGADVSKEAVDDKTLDLSVSHQANSASSSQRITGQPMTKNVVTGARKNKRNIQSYFTSPAHKLQKTSPYKEQSMFSPMEVVNGVVTMDTPQQDTSEATSSSVTMEMELPSNCEYIKNNIKDDGDVMSEVVCGERTGSELVTVKCDECGRDIPLDVWIEHDDYHVATKLQESFNRTPITIPSVPRSSSSSQTSRNTSRTNKKTSSAKDKSSQKTKKPQSSTLDRFLNKSST